MNADSVEELHSKEALRLRRKIRRERAIRLEAEKLGEAATERLFVALEALDQKNVELVVALDRAQSANQSKTAFLQQIRHELRTPLNAIGPLLQAGIEMISETDVAAYAILKEANSAYEDLYETVRKLVELAEIGTLPRPEVRSFSLSGLMRAVVDEFRARAQDSGVDLVWTLDASDPSFQDSVLGDPIRISRVLSALVENSIQYAPGEDVEITASSIKEEGSIRMVEFSVDDAGPGLSNLEISSMQEALSQAGQTPNGRASGLGVGLTVAASLVASLGGQLAVSSSSRSGLKVTFTVPFVPEAGSPDT